MHYMGTYPYHLAEWVNGVAMFVAGWWASRYLYG
jgi:hypothetical protein